MEIQLNLYPGSALLLTGSHGLVCVDTISISGHHSNPMDTHVMCGHHSNWWTPYSPSYFHMMAMVDTILNPPPRLPFPATFSNTNSIPPLLDQLAGHHLQVNYLPFTFARLWVTEHPMNMNSHLWDYNLVRVDGDLSSHLTQPPYQTPEKLNL